MPNLPKGTHVADHKCGGCGKSVKVLLNVNGNAYFNCPHIDDDLDRCNHSERWGRKDSQAMQRAYLDARKQSKKNVDEVKQDDTTQPAEPIGDGIEISDKPGSGGGAIFDAFG